MHPERAKTHHLAKQPPRLVEEEGDEADVFLIGGRVHVADDEEGRGLGKSGSWLLLVCVSLWEVDVECGSWVVALVV